MSKLCVWFWCAVAVCATAPLPAQEEEPVGEKRAAWRLAAFFWHESSNDEEALVGIRRALEAWGHPYILDVVRAGGDEKRAKLLLDGLAAQDQDLVFALGTRAAILCRNALKDRPVVFTAVTNPVESGVVPSWLGSESQLCGNSNWIGSGTVLEVFRLAVPKLQRLGVLRSRRSGVVSGAEVRAMRRYLESEGKELGVELVEEVVEGEDADPAAIRAATERLVKQGVSAIWVPIDFAIYENLGPVTAVVRPARVPLVSSSVKGARGGAVAGVVVDYRLLGERAVLTALDVLAKGAKPGDLPIGTLRSYRVVVNLDAARALDYRPPLSLLALADQILDEKAAGQRAPAGQGR